MRRLFLLVLFVMACKGQEGPAGLNGSPSVSVSSELLCTALDAGSGATAIYTYEIITYSSGDKLVICSLRVNAGQYENAVFLKQSQGGNQNASCVVNTDVDAATAGFWTFTSQGGVTKNVYSDAGSVHNNYSYTFTSGNCQSL